MTMKPFCVRGFAAVIPSRDSQWVIEIPAHLKRRDPRIWQMAWVAVSRLLKNAIEPPKSLAVATALGALDETKNYLDGVFKDGFGSPKNFIASVHNSMAGKLALEFKIDGPNLTLCDGQNSLASAIAACSLYPGSAFPCLVVAVDEHIPLLSELVPHCSPACRQFLADAGQEAAVALLLDRRLVPEHPALRATAPVALCGREPAALSAELAAGFDGCTARTDIPVQDCRSFISAALKVHDMLVAGKAGRFIVPTFSPPSKACAALELTL